MIQPPRYAQSGFSLIEILVALAILSVTSVIIFQSLSAQLRLVNRVGDINAERFEDLKARDAFRSIIGGLTPGWPEEERGPFRGGANALSGITSGPLHPSDLGLQYFDLRIDPDRFQLVYFGNDTEIPMATFSGPVAFQYLGANGVWYESWPAPEKIVIGAFDDTNFYKPPPLPKAVRIRAVDTTMLDWIGQVDWNATYLFREQDLELGQ
ncbi:MAG: prepilin-type N-terminal cleavage/methylation domain-containing protein [Pseudomonadota bacterium]